MRKATQVALITLCSACIVLLVYGCVVTGRTFVAYSKAAWYEHDVCQAARTGDNARIRSLLIKGASVNSRCDSGNDFGKTALIIAIENHHPTTVKYLLEQGANPELGDDPTSGGHTAMDYAISAGDFTSFTYVSSHYDRDVVIRYIYMGTAYDRLDIMTYILGLGMEPTITDPNGHTPLHKARSKEAVRLLVTHGLDVNARSDEGETPLHTAHTAEVADELLKHGADSSARTNAGMTPIDIARSHSRDDVIAVLEAQKSR